VTIFDTIREASAAVMRRALAVHIDADGLDAFAERLDIGEVFRGPDDPAHRAWGSPEETIAFVVTLDALNFGSGYFPYMRKRRGCSGYMTVATALEERFRERGAFSAADLRQMRPEDCAEWLGQNLQVAEMAEWMGLFARSLSDLGRFLGERFGGSFEKLIAAGRGRAEQLVRLLAEMPLYRDVANYADFQVPFYKRAQITCADLALAFADRGPGAFRDIDQLTLFADNLVPHVLRREGVLVYAPELLARIAREEPILAGSTEEVEIRAGALHAVERLCARLGERGRRVSARRLDQLLWESGQSPEMKSEPRHRCRSVYY